MTSPALPEKSFNSLFEIAPELSHLFPRNACVLHLENGCCWNYANFDANSVEVDWTILMNAANLTLHGEQWNGTWIQ